MSERPRVLTAEHRAKLSSAWETRRLIPVSQATREKLSRAGKGRVSPNRGRETSEETRAKISAALKGRKKSPETRARIAAAQRGKNLSSSHRLAISIGHKGQQPTDKNKLAIAAAMKRPEVRAKISAALIGKPQPREFAERRTRAAIAGLAATLRPNGLERLMLSALVEWFREEGWSYNRDVIVGGKIPDFVHGKKKLAVDIHGDYVHGILRKEGPREDQIRQRVFQESGWRLVVVWESEFRCDPEGVRRRILDAQA